MVETYIGEITHFYSKIYVAVLKLSGEVNTGNLVHIVGHTTDFIQQVRSMEIDHRPVLIGCVGQEVALKVLQLVRKGDAIYKVTSAEAQQEALEGPTFIETNL